MPNINGIECINMLKEKVSGKASFVLVSSVEWSTFEEEMKDAGIYNFLPKPFFPHKVASVIDDCLGMARQTVDEKPVNTENIFARHSILLVEDVEINREIVTALLEPTLIKIDCAENGKIALDMFSATPEKYDLIFMDMQMPEMDGLEATRKIRALDVARAKTVPIIAMTANAFKEDIEHCLAAGMNAHVGKPLNFDEVMDKLRAYLT
jgi:CheY-like chemotaxis protein